MHHSTIEEDVERDYDRWLVLFATIALIVSTTLILDERLLFRFRSKGHGSAVANISDTTNDVRRRVIGDLAFFPAENSDGLFDGDSIFTGADSSSRINFKSGSTITLNPETMIVIEGEGEKTGLNVKQGSFSASLTKGENLTVNVGNEKTVLNGDDTKVLVSKGIDGKAQIKVQKGSVLMTGPKGQTRVSAAEPPSVKPLAPPVVVAKAEVAAVPVLDFGLVSPIKDGATWYQSSDTVNFNWKEQVGSNYKFTVSKDKDFKQIIKEENTEKPFVGIMASTLSFGVPLYWKVENLSTHATSPVQQFQIHQDDPPSLLNSKKTENLKAQNLSHSLIQVRWEPLKNEKNYTIQVSKDQDFSTLLVNQDVKASSYKITTTFFGNYYWRVKSNSHERRHSPWSSTGVVSVAKAKEPPPPKVVERPKTEAPKAPEPPKQGGFQAFDFSD